MKLRKLLAVALSLTIFCGATSTIIDYNKPNSYFTASAVDIIASGECGENAKWQIDSEGTLIISGEGEIASTPWMSDHKNDIKTLIVNNGITHICTDAFKSTSVQSAEIADSVVVMREGTFDNCRKLTSLKLSNSLKKICVHMFYGCSSLTSFDFPDSVEEIESFSFSNTGIKEIVIPESVSKIGTGAFDNITDFKSITILNPNCSISNSCIKDGTVIGYSSSTAQIFAEKNGFTFKSLDASPIVTTSTNNTAPDVTTTQASVNPENIIASGTCGESTAWILDNEGTLTISGEGEISFKPWLTEHKNDIKTIIVNNGITHICTDAFKSTSVQRAEIADSVVVMREGTFDNCRKLTSLKLSNSLKKICVHMFYGCSSLTSFDFPDSVEEIESFSFSNTGIKEIVIPESVSKIGTGAFDNITDFKSITILNPNCSISNSCIKDGTVIGYSSSTAQIFAEKNGFTFKSLGEAPASSTTVKVTTIPVTTTTTTTTSSLPSSTAATTAETNISTEKPATTTATYKTETSASAVTTTTTVASTTEESTTTNSTTAPLTVVGKWKHDKTYDGAGNLVQIPDDICMNIEFREDYTALISAFSSSAWEKYDAVWRTEGDIIIISITEPNEDIMKLTFDSENQILSTCEFDDGSGRKAYFVRSDTSTLGDINSDGKVDAKDASLILLEYAQASTGAEDVIAEEQKKDADVNRDGKVDAKDASAILQYYAYTSTGGKDPIDQYLG